MKINFDRSSYEQLEQYFRDACNVNLFFLDETGEFRYLPKISCDICEQVRNIPQLFSQCQKCTSEAKKTCQQTRKLQIYQCHLGFTEIMLPIFIDNICVGYLTFGQIINTDNPLTLHHIENTLKESFHLYNFTIDDLSVKINQSVKMTTQRIKSVAELMKICASHLILSEIIKLETLTTPIMLENYIAKNLKEPLRSEDLCKEFNISRSQLYLIAQKNFNCGISKYIQTKRIERAKELLTTSSYEIAHIGEEVGIIDNAYFSRIFKQSTGYSPREYRQKFPQS